MHHRHADTALPTHHAYPRPQLRRAEWYSLNGEWDFSIDVEASLAGWNDVTWASTIRVPFAPETEASGIGQTHLFKRCWYRRSFVAPPRTAQERLLLHFGAVDYSATAWVNGQLAVEHEGGYTPFSVDVTPLLHPDDRPNIIVVRADDDPSDLAKPRGKQDWQLEPHSIWYPRTSGIWQTVWIERVPARSIAAIRWTPNLERWELGCVVTFAGASAVGCHLRVVLRTESQLLADDTYLVTSDEVHRRIVLSDPGIDDYRNTLLWNPESPRLISAELTLSSPTGELVDTVSSYTALRSIAVDGNRIVLNGRPYYLRMVLDQGYWPGSGLTAPDDEALKRDVELAKAMGFNGVRKHQKIEDPRYLFWADRLGLLVWEEMPSAYRFTRDSIHRTTREWMAVLARDSSHPCIVAWVPFNESWGVPNLPMNAAERHYVHGLYHLTKTLDASRPVVGNDGWESIATDIVGIHDYDPNPEHLAQRYLGDDILPRLFKRERPGGRMLVLEGDRHVDQPLVLSEFGGITLSTDAAGTWGYSRAVSGATLAEHYAALLTAVRTRCVLSGFCYTQFAYTFQEANGLLYADRRPKFPIEDIRKATSG